ncbi:hypothetical protein TB2_043074 [Malus domestica]|uniref:Uncharacterized protein n=1 Tax=Malus domestica TaxID=3750 RepID=A0A498J761_MALDO|nr:hypothetical protein DVH24_020632 [Malus domestica]
MDLVQDLFLTASLALILSFLVAKLVALAVAGRESEAELGEGGNGGGEGVGVEEVSFEERRLKVEGAFRGQSQRRVELEGEVKEVVRFEGEAVHQAEEIAEPLQQHREGRGLTEEMLEEESVAVVMPEKWSAAVGLPEKWSDDGEFEGEAVHRAQEIAEPLQQHREGRGLTEEQSVAVVLPEKSSVAVGLPEKWSDGGEFEEEAVHRAEVIVEPLQQHREGCRLTEEELVAVVLPEKSSVAVGLPEKWSDGGEFEEEAVHRAEVIVEPLQQHREGRRLTEEESVAVVLPEKSSVAVGLPEKRSDGGEMEKASEFDRGCSENREAEEIGAKSAGNDAVAEQSEMVRVVDCEETKEKTHVAPIEVKSGDFSDEDDWEGIEKSELDDEYAAAVKSDGHY